MSKTMMQEQDLENGRKRNDKNWSQMVFFKYLKEMFNREHIWERINEAYNT